MGVIFLVRHGTILSNKQKVYAGWREEELDVDGVDDARRAGSYLHNTSARKIFTSPLKRARQTAEILSEYLPDAQIIMEEGLKEMRLGPWEGMSETAIADKYPEEFMLWNEKPGELEIPGRETLRNLQDRALDAIEKINRQCRDQDSIAVTHVAIIRTLWLFFNNMHLNLYKTIDVPNGAIFKLAVDSQGGIIGRLK